MGSTFG